MRIRIITFHPEPKYVYHQSHLFTSFLENTFNECFTDVNTDINLNLSIVCLSDNIEKVKLGGNMKHLGKEDTVTQQIILPNKHLYFESSHVFNQKKFDFVPSNSTYQCYPLDLFAKFTLKGLLTYLTQNELETPDDHKVLAFEHVVSDELAKNAHQFNYKNEELMHLQELIDKTHWAYEDMKGKEWLESDIGQKWVELAKKYSFDTGGNLVVKP